MAQAAISGVGGVAFASSASGGSDGSAVYPAVSLARSETPFQVRDGSAKLVGALNATQMLRLSVGLKSRDLSGQERFLRELQDKASPNFHKYLSAQEWIARYSPSPAAEGTVLSWAKSVGFTVTNRFPNRLLVDVEAPTAVVEKALSLHLNNYRLGTKTVFSNDRDPVLPAAVSTVTETVDGLNNIQVEQPQSNIPQPAFKTYAPGAVKKAGLSGRANGSKAALAAARAGHDGPNITGGSYDPTDIYSSQAYNTTGLNKHSACCNPFHASSHPRETTIAIPTAGAHNGNDIVGFQARYNYLAYSWSEWYIDGTPTCCDGEGQMDLEWSTALANSFGSYLDTAHVIMYSGINSNFSTFNDVYNFILTDNATRVMSTSWGCAEVYCVDTGTMNTRHNIFNSMAGQGWTLISASGDKGAYADCSHKSALFPATDPNMVAAGGTNLELTSGPVYSSEAVWGGNPNGCASNGGGSGGGCSTVWDAPNTAMTTSNPNYFCNDGNGHNRRSVPDISLNADWYYSPQNLYFNGAWQGNGGTSIVAPELGGYFAQQNSYLMTLGNICGLGSGTSACSPFGVPLAALYTVAEGGAPHNPYYDIVSGNSCNNIGCGFYGITGYDRGSGWGSLNMMQLAWALNYRTVAENGAPSVAFGGVPASTWLNSGTITWNVTDNGSGSYAASGLAGHSAQWNSDPGDPTGHASPGTGDSFYSGPTSAHGVGSSSTAVSAAGEGCHTLYVRGWDNMGKSTVGANSYCYDGTNPVMTRAPASGFIKGGQVRKTNEAPIRTTWAATDARSGVASYYVYMRVDGGSYSPVTLASPTSTSVDLGLLPGHSYQFAVGATDRAGNFSGYSYQTPFQLKAFQNTNSAVAYSAGWTQQSFADASGGNVRYSTVAGKTATFTFTGNKVALVSTVDTNRGAGTWKLDAAGPISFGTNGAYKPRTIVQAGPTSGAGTHHLVINNSGTSGHPRLDVDAFYVII
jgi:kumamolisin